MDLFEAIKQRHSYRGEFASAPVPREDLKKIVQAGLDAPSGCNAQTTEFIIVDDHELIAKISSIFDKVFVTEAKALIVCLVNLDAQPVFADMSFELEDCSAAVENMLLAITALGYSSVWLDGMLRHDNAWKKIAEILGIPENKRPQVLLPVGKAVSEVRVPGKKPFEDRAWFNTYGK